MTTSQLKTLTASNIVIQPWIKIFQPKETKTPNWSCLLKQWLLPIMLTWGKDNWKISINPKDPKITFNRKMCFNSDKSLTKLPNLIKSWAQKTTRVPNLLHIKKHTIHQSQSVLIKFHTDLKDWVCKIKAKTGLLSLYYTINKVLVIWGTQPNQIQETSWVWER